MYVEILILERANGVDFDFAKELLYVALDLRHQDTGELHVRWFRIEGH